MPNKEKSSAKKLDTSGLRNYDPDGVNIPDEWLEKAMAKHESKQKNLKVVRALEKPNKPLSKKTKSKVSTKSEKDPGRPEIGLNEPKWKRDNRSRKYDFKSYDELPPREKQVLDHIAIQVNTRDGKRSGEYYFVEIPTIEFKINGLHREHIKNLMRSLVKRNIVQCELIQGGKYSIKKYLIHYKIWEKTPAKYLKI